MREALINSLCHRQWEKYNLTNSIAIYDDRVEIANPGIFPLQITPETIKESHESYPYNLKIAVALYKSTYLESWGSGAKRIMDACREQGIEEPIWRCDGGFVIVTFKRPFYGLNHQEKKSAKENLWGNVTQNVAGNSRYNKQEIPTIMTGTSLLPFYSAGTTTKLARALLILQR